MWILGNSTNSDKCSFHHHRNQYLYFCNSKLYSLSKWKIRRSVSSLFISSPFHCIFRSRFQNSHYLKITSELRIRWEILLWNWFRTKTQTDFFVCKAFCNGKYPNHNYLYIFNSPFKFQQVPTYLDYII